ncbi:hypothetical protein ONZ45_g13992 [Pleurotus djamor]|nr:hypothetical protein ONZ45_g13992 [Pleurotus djamor]
MGVWHVRLALHLRLVAEREELVQWRGIPGGKSPKVQAQRVLSAFGLAFHIIMDDEEAELRNPFPSPPSHYTNYTSHNLKLLALLKERSGNEPDANQFDVLRDQTDVPEWPLTQLEKPRVDWILEEPEPYYEVYGEKWPMKDIMPSLGEIGGTQLYPEDPSAEAPPEWGRRAEWIDVLAQNMMFAANELRPIQARANLEGMMRRQIELRRQETSNLHTKCDYLEAKLAELRSIASTSSSHPHSQQSKPAPPVQVSAHVSLDDVLRWAEEAR